MSDETKSLWSVADQAEARDLAEKRLSEHSSDQFRRTDYYDMLKTGFVAGRQSCIEHPVRGTHSEEEIEKYSIWIGENFVMIGGDTWAHQVEDSAKGTYGVRYTSRQLLEKFLSEQK